MKITNSNAKREVLAYLMFLAIFWGFLYLVGKVESLFGLYDQAWITSWTRNALDYIALVLAIVIANRIGSISYWGLSFIALFGTVGLAQVRFFTVNSAFIDSIESISISPWYTYIFFMVQVCFILYVVRHITKRLSARLWRRTQLRCAA